MDLHGNRTCKCQGVIANDITHISQSIWPDLALSCYLWHIANTIPSQNNGVFFKIITMATIISFK